MGSTNYVPSAGDSAIVTEECSTRSCWEVSWARRNGAHLSLATSWRLWIIVLLVLAVIIPEWTDSMVIL